MQFDPKRLTQKGEEIRTLEVEGHGTVKYGPLVMKDMLEVFGRGFDVDHPNPDPEQAVKLGYLMLKKGYPDFSWEDFLKWPPEEMGPILSALLEAGDFRDKD